MCSVKRFNILISQTSDKALSSAFDVHSSNFYLDYGQAVPALTISFPKLFSLFLLNTEFDEY